MPEYTQLQNDQPIIRESAVASAASGKEAIAEAFGRGSQAAFKQAEEVANEQSNAQLMISANQAEQIKTQTQIDILKNPSQADQIYEKAKYTLGTIKESAYVNKHDRSKLDYLVDRSDESLRLHAAETSIRQATRGLSIAFWDNYPTTMQGIQEALNSGDFKTAEILEDSLNKNALNAVQAGAITPEQFSTIKKASLGIYNRTKNLMEMMKSGEALAGDYHAGKLSPFSNSSVGNENHPVDHNTLWVADHYNADRSIQGQFVALYDDKPINFGVVAQANENEYFKFTNQLMGVNSVKGAIQGGVPFNQIAADIEALQSKPKLNAYEEGKVNYWKSYTSRLNTMDSFLQTMSHTVLGSRFTKNFHDENEAIENSAKTPEQKFTAVRDNTNNYIGNMINAAHAQHLDPNFIKPIPTQWSQTVRSAFIDQAPVQPALDQISYVKPEYRAYLADAMKKPHQSMAVYLAGLGMENGIDPSFQANLIAANQERNYDSLLKSGKEETRVTDIWRDVVSDSNMSLVYEYLGKLPGASKSQKGFQDTATNYVQYQAVKRGDVMMVNKSQYVDEFRENISKSFNLVKSDRYLFNASDIPLRKVDMDYLSDYALSQAYQRLHAGRTEAEFQAYVDLNPLIAISTPDKRIVVINQNGHAAVDREGHEAFDQPYVSSMLSAAHANAKETQEFMSTYFGLSENLQRMGRIHPGYPFALRKDKNANQTLSALIKEE